MPTAPALGQAAGHGLDALRGEDAALGRREIGADQHLDRRDGRAEGRQVALDQGRHDAHQHLPADFAGAGRGKGGSERNASISSSPCSPSCVLVEDQDDAPFVRKGQPRDDRRRPPLPSLPASTITPPLSKLAMPMPDRRRAPAASRRRRYRAADRAACAAPQRPQARSGCRSRDRHGAEWRCSTTRRCWRVMPRCLQSVDRCSPGAVASGPSTMVSPARDRVTTVSGSLSGRPRLPKRRPASPLRSRKPRCRRAGTLMVTEFDICPPMGAS